MLGVLLIFGIVAFFGLVIYVTDLNKNASFRNYVIEEVIAPTPLDTCDCDGIGMCNDHIDEMLTQFPIPTVFLEDYLHSQSAFPLTDDIEDDEDRW